MRQFIPVYRQHTRLPFSTPHADLRGLNVATTPETAPSNIHRNHAEAHHHA